MFISEKESEENRLKKEKEKNELRKKQLKNKEDERIRKEKSRWLLCSSIQNISSIQCSVLAKQFSYLLFDFLCLEKAQEEG